MLLKIEDEIFKMSQISNIDIEGVDMIFLQVVPNFFKKVLSRKVLEARRHILLLFKPQEL